MLQTGRCAHRGGRLRRSAWTAVRDSGPCRQRTPCARSSARWTASSKATTDSARLRVVNSSSRAPMAPASSRSTYVIPLHTKPDSLLISCATASTFPARTFSRRKLTQRSRTSQTASEREIALVTSRTPPRAVASGRSAPTARLTHGEWPRGARSSGSIPGMGNWPLNRHKHLGSYGEPIESWIIPAMTRASSTIENPTRALTIADLPRSI